MRILPMGYGYDRAVDFLPLLGAQSNLDPDRVIIDCEMRVSFSDRQGEKRNQIHNDGLTLTVEDRLQHIWTVAYNGEGITQIELLHSLESMGLAIIPGSNVPDAIFNKVTWKDEVPKKLRKEVVLDPVENIISHNRGISHRARRDSVLSGLRLGNPYNEQRRIFSALRLGHITPGISKKLKSLLAVDHLIGTCDGDKVMGYSEFGSSLVGQIQSAIVGKKEYEALALCFNGGSVAAREKPCYLYNVNGNIFALPIG